MARNSVSTFLDDFRDNGTEVAILQRRGYRTERWTYADVAACAARVARELEARGVTKGERILLWGPNSAEWVASFFACASLGATAVPLDHAATADFADRVAAQVTARVAFCTRDHIAALPGVDCIPLEGLREVVAAYSSDPYPAPDLAPSDPLEIIFTSGTTADPKGVIITHGNVLANIAPIETEMARYRHYERWVHPVRFLNLLPLSHVFGQFLGIFLPPLLAATVLFQDALGPSDVLAAIHKERISVLVAVPRMLQSLREKLLRDYDAASTRTRFDARFRTAAGKHFLYRWWIFRDVHRQFGWKFWAMISGGAALDAETEEFWGHLGYAVIQGYGLTETTSLISLNHPFKLGKGSIGKVLPGREIKLADDGEILVRGAGVASGYWEAGAARPVADAEGWYRTGDIGTLDADGNLYFKGRKKDVLVTPAGMNIYPADLEVALRRQPEVRDCVIVADERGGNAEPLAVLLLRDASASGTDVIRRANESLAEYQRMRRWFVWPDADFPRTPTQKPRTALIRDAALAALNQDQAANTATEANFRPAFSTSALAELIALISGHNIAVLRNADLADDLGLSSLERVELMSVLEDRYQVDLSETAFTSARTVADLEQVLAGRGERIVYHYPRWTLSFPFSWIRIVAYYALTRPAIILLGWPRIEGREHLRDLAGPILVVCNHLDDVDPGFVLTALPPRLRHHLAVATGGETLQSYRTPPAGTGLIRRLWLRLKWTLGAMFLNLFPLPRAAGFQKSFAYAGECVDRGYSVLIFPEGKHTRDGKLLPFQAGAGMLARHLDIPVVPMSINGLFDVKHAGRTFALPHAITVRVGAPLRFATTDDPRTIAARLQQEVAALGANRGTS
jgi:long-chain acyl-CoA synthetase